MKRYYKNRFALTDSGARDLTRATIRSFLVYCINMLPAFIIMILANDILSGKKTIESIYILLALGTLILMNFLLSIEYDALFSTTYKESANLRIKTAENLSKLPLSYFSKHDLSDTSQTIMADIEGIEHAMSHSIPKVGGMAIFFPILAIMMLAGNVKMGLAVIVPSILSFLFIPLSKKIQVRGHKKYYETLRRNSEAFQENIEMHQEIKSFNLVKDMRKKLFDIIDESEKIHLQTEGINIAVVSTSAIFAFISLAVVILVGINLIIGGEITALYLLGYLLTAIKIKDALDSSKEGMMEIFYLSPKIERIKEMKEAKIQEGSDLEFDSFDIELKDVFFSYSEDSQLLKGISFKANQGEVTALVGTSGSGKTSILRLISRLYDYDRGKILIGGKDIKGISTKSLFSKTSIVFQDVTLFNTSIMENIRIGRKDASDEEVIEAGRMANCTEFVEKMPDGYNTIIGENGAELSGGERQRLSIARAFLKDSPILILDEIAASLDVDNEKKIQDSLNHLIKNKTVIIISHRLKSIENANKIVVLKDGRVESEGSHEDLLKNSSVYKNLIDRTKMAEEFVY